MYMYAACLAALSIVTSSGASRPATDRPTIQVVFRLTEPTFSGNYSNAPGPDGSPSELVVFENAVARRLAFSLEDSFGFLAFTTGPADLQLHAILESEDNASFGSQVSGTHIRCLLTGETPGSREEPLPLPFSSNTAAGSFSKRGAEQRVERAFRTGIAANRDQLMLRFARIPLGSSVYLFTQPQPSGVLPFSYEDLKARESSRFLIEARGSPAPRRYLTEGLPRPEAPMAIPGPFDTGIPVRDWAEAPPGCEPLSKLASADGVVNDVQLYVVAYDRDYRTPFAPNDPAAASSP